MSYHLLLLDHYGEEGSWLLPVSCWTCMAETWKTTRLYIKSMEGKLELKILLNKRMVMPASESWSFFRGSIHFVVESA
ncbi:hypothetical protein BT93_L2621 [Corymbia citriodora subsp. variegata]|uniref:Uncharacterized protein n=1 Tax=Corymbia citriodora subsp. variegata TaxID=360336 RepID=A0A8T0CYK3_CORYI|nr:hypothetical protein BT93_L2621 [Corymbia citriodora subsp. variegata]